MGVRLEISNWSDRQRELRALIFLSDDHRNQNPTLGSLDVPALRYGEIKFPYQGHQERPDLRDTLVNWMSVHNSDRRKYRRLTQTSNRYSFFVQ